MRPLLLLAPALALACASAEAPDTEDKPPVKRQRATITQFDLLDAQIAREEFQGAFQLTEFAGSSRASVQFTNGRRSTELVRRVTRSSVALVVAGTLQLKLATPSGELLTQDLEAGDFALIPGDVARKLTALGDDEVKLLEIHSPGYADVAAFESARQAIEVVSEEAVPKPAQPAQVGSVWNAQVEEGFKVRSQVLAEHDDATVRFVEMRGNLEPRRHSGSDLILTFLAGGGVLYLESLDGGVQSHEVSAGTIVHIPATVGYGYTHLSNPDDPTQAFAVYCPRLAPGDTADAKWKRVEVAKAPAAGVGPSGNGSPGDAPR